MNERKTENTLVRWSDNGAFQVSVQTIGCGPEDLAELGAFISNLHVAHAEIRSRAKVGEEPCGRCSGLTILPNEADADGRMRCACGKLSAREDGSCEDEHEAVPCPDCARRKEDANARAVNAGVAQSDSVPGKDGAEEPGATSSGSHVPYDGDPRLDRNWLGTEQREQSPQVPGSTPGPSVDRTSASSGPEPLCNLCGLTCHLNDGSPASGEHGLINARVSGGYASTPGNGNGALDDGDTYTFSLCEFCLDWLFSRFQRPVAIRCYLSGETVDWQPAHQRVALDDWRKQKAAFVAEARRRDEHRSPAVVTARGEPAVRLSVRRYAALVEALNEWVSRRDLTGTLALNVRSAWAAVRDLFSASPADLSPAPARTITGTTISDLELERWGTIRRADEADAFDFSKHGWSPAYILTFLSRETLEMRRLLRELIARHEPNTADPVVRRAVELLGTNLESSQPLFPTWPVPTRDAPDAHGDLRCVYCEAEGGPTGVLLVRFVMDRRWRCYEAIECEARRNAGPR